MPQKGILEVEIFDVWGVDFIGPLPFVPREFIHSSSGGLRIQMG
ncbi:unnamed protein product [Rhodiola kirilowii]